MSIEVDVRARRGAFLLEGRFSVEQPGVTALFGPSGAGKTSMVQAIAGLMRPEHGAITLNGRKVFDARENINIPARARRVGYVFQDARLFPHMSVERNILFGWRRSNAPLGKAEISEIVDLLGIGQLRNRSPRSLSGGEKQRVAIGRALLASPEVLLLDEPLASLDAARREEILPYLERLRDGRRLPILYVSHSIEEVARLADAVVVMNEGRVIEQGSIFDIISRIDPKKGVVLAVTVAGHRDDGLTELAFDGGRLLVQRIRSDVGSRRRVRIAASDVMLSLEAPVAISANNVIAARIAALTRQQDGAVDAELVAGNAKIFARITAASAARLALTPGLEVYAIVKAVTVDTAIRVPD